jgi:hypothetical protein
LERIQTGTEFTLWIDVVNEALHGWDILDLAHHGFLLSRNELSFYLAYLNDIPIATAATIQYENQASIEFVATLEHHSN